MRPSHSTLPPGGRRRQGRRLGALPRHPQDRVGVEAGERLQEHLQPLARLVAADEEDRPPAAAGRVGHRPGIGLGEPLDLDPVGQDVAGAAQPALGQRPGPRGRRPSAGRCGGPRPARPVAATRRPGPGPRHGRSPRRARSRPGGRSAPGRAPGAREGEGRRAARRRAPRGCGGWPSGRRPGAPRTRWRPATRSTPPRSRPAPAAPRRRVRGPWPRRPTPAAPGPDRGPVPGPRPGATGRRGR